jgi:hypothetical protein
LFQELNLKLNRLTNHAELNQRVSLQNLSFIGYSSGSQGFFAPYSETTKKDPEHKKSMGLF